MISLPFLFRILGASSYGAIASAYSFFMFCNIIIDFGYDLSATRLISLHINDKKRINKIVITTLLSKLIITVICVLFALIVIFFIPNFKNNYLLFLLMLGIPIGNCLLPIWFFQGIEKMKYLTVICTLTKLLSYIPMFIFVRNHDDVNIVSICYSCGYLFSGFASVFVLYYRFSIRYTKLRLSDLVTSLKDSSPFFLSRISASLYSVGNTIVLGLICGNEIAGYYNVSEKVVQAFTGLISPFTQSLYPYMIKNKDVKLFKKVILLGTFVGLVVSLLMFFFAPVIMNVVFDCSEIISIRTFRILSLMLFFVVPSYLLGYPFLAALGYIKFTNLSVLIAGILYLLIIVILYFSDFISIYSIAFLYVFVEFSVFVMRLYGVKKYKLL